MNLKSQKFVALTYLTNLQLNCRFLFVVFVEQFEIFRVLPYDQVNQRTQPQEECSCEVQCIFHRFFVVNPTVALFARTALAEHFTCAVENPTEENWTGNQRQRVNEHESESHSDGFVTLFDASDRYQIVTSSTQSSNELDETHHTEKESELILAVNFAVSSSRRTVEALRCKSEVY